MKLIKLGTITALSLSFSSYAGEKITAEFLGAKISTVVDALSMVSNQNIVWDKDAIAQKDKIVSLSIKKPLEIEKVLNTVLLQNGFIAVKQDNLYIIKATDEYFVNVPQEITSTFGKDIFDTILLNIKSKASSNAQIDVDRNSYSIYIKDDKESINRIKNFMTAYLDYLKKEADKISKIQQSEGKIIKKEFDISYEDFKKIENKIAENISPIGKYSYDKEKNKLIILDTEKNLSQMANLVAKSQQIQITTKCFYIRGLEPGELILNIKENDLSPNGVIIYQGKIISKPQQEVGQSQIGQKTQAAQVATGVETLVTSLPKVCISDEPKIIENIKNKYSEILLTKPYQIAIEARIVQIDSQNLKDLGIQWGGQASDNTNVIAGTNSPSPIARPGVTGLTTINGAGGAYAVDFPASSSQPLGGFSLGFIHGGLNNFIDVRLSALQRIGVTKILSRPKIVTIDGETAEITQGYQVPYTTVTSVGGGASAASVSFKNAVLKLNVTPRTTSDGNIIMDIKINQDIPDFKNLVAGNPPIQTKTVTSKVVAKDGDTIVIGGILEKTEENTKSGVPGLMNIPILGALFKEELNREQNTELLIFLSAKIIYE
ncbi:hypothetical protein JCM14244_04260 [Venenivibrio stagnispumantis]|uniref:Type IV pilus assembly protein PilQ n=1 Tax=Venenivibrio stagnispumantis TaxID=407998 RepID=A0AA45WJU0_9AQUI|nr:pilus assembly protein PilQ [Venenivibrio stagnispumantis]MCW4572936.1 pilus assembly protein PilQ [Venenivibrio stagnispumantis]SMP04762.1 type IV pilus assembly protein PilQ [Venenivibrio stagnispumantis]